MANSNWLDDVLDEIVHAVPTCPQSPKQNWGQSKEAETSMDKGSVNSVPSVPSVPAKNDRFVKKSADIVETQCEQRRKKVLTMLSENPTIQRAFVTDAESDPDNVILTVAIRDVASFEMLIPREKYDPFLLLQTIERGGVQ